MNQLRTRSTLILCFGVIAILIFMLTPRSLGTTHAPSGKAWLSLSPDQKLSTLSELIGTYKLGWFDGYVARANRDAPAGVDEPFSLSELDTDSPKFSRPLSEYVVEVTAYFQKPYPLTPGTSLENVIGCLADHPKYPRTAMCSHFPKGK